MNKNGFSLIEVLLYVAILAIVSGLFVGILSVSTKVQLRETANNEVSTQLNFVLQTIQRLVRESSNIEFAGSGDNLDTAVTEAAYIKLRMPKSTDDPTCIAWVPADKSILLTQGPQGVGNEHKCKNPTSGDALTTAKVIVPVSPPGFVATKFSNYPGHDSVQVDLTLDYNTDNPQSAFQKKLTTAIGRVSAATFDSGLFPGVSGLDIGLSAPRWAKLFVNNIDVSGTISQPENFGAGPPERGYMVIGVSNFLGIGPACQDVCPTHGLTCALSLRIPSMAAVGCTEDTEPGYICFCQ